MKTRIVKEHIDYDTGEVKSASRVFTKKIEYHYSQINDLVASEIFDLTGLELKMLIVLEIFADHETNEPDPRKYKKIMEMYNIKSGTFYNIRSRLRNKGMLIEHKGCVIVNPLYFWRGTVKDREHILEEIRQERLSSTA